ncbi:class I SAM-dependent methyltransferase [Nonomuraea sp. NPDC050556]|uniref:class I SAM-dependent methyltransferase n=1 Tax=Nonomuraea sp. NPDC050556 TaxID=3364369 RepID=UPI00378E9C4E
MGIGKLLHHHTESSDGGGTIDHPRTYEAIASLLLLGARRRYFTRLAALSGARQDDRVLDVGCGTGYLTRILATRAGRVTGVDLSSAMIGYARRRAPANCDYVVGEGQALDLPDASFDVVVSSLAVHHIPSGARAAAIREMFRVLRPGGRLMIAEFRPPTGHVSARVVGMITGPAMLENLRDQILRLLADAGFRFRDEGRVGPVLTYLRAVRPDAD